MIWSERIPRSGVSVEEEYKDRNIVRGSSLDLKSVVILVGRQFENSESGFSV
jgi:hypothetical protein